MYVYISIHAYMYDNMIGSSYYDPNSHIIKTVVITDTIFSITKRTVSNRNFLKIVKLVDNENWPWAKLYVPV